MTIKNIKALLLGILVTTALSVYTIGCADDPSSLGINFIPPGDTTGVRIFDSFTDSMPITSSNRILYVNTSGSANLMVGKSGSIESKGLVVFGNFGSDLDSATVQSATMTLAYNNYYYPASSSDSLGQMSFEVYKIQQYLNFSTITVDSVNSSSFGNVSQGTFTGTPTADSQDVSISLNTSMVKDWLEYAADTAYANKNYGIALTPNAGTSVIKSFYSGLAVISASVRPRLEVIYVKSGVTDTLYTDGSATVSLVNGSIPNTSETFNLQAGISFVQVMQFDLSRFPQTATVNDVQLYLTLDSANSVFTNQSNNSVFAQFITDSAGLVTESFQFNGGSSGSGQYMLRLVSNRIESPFARWLVGTTNYGILLVSGTQNIALDSYTFYSEHSVDPSKRPRVIIKYTPRVNP
ncbi:MAG: DNRLRE domain-containing protein [Ignavibacteria bacterium]|nr:DNRLRE domain-containing protein [Ignavibacteria bacterium]